MAFSANRKGTAFGFYSAPVETVWRLIVGDGSTQISPMDEDEYNNTDPKPGTAYTKAFEIIQNEKFEFEIKTKNVVEHWTILMNDTGVAETRVRCTNEVVYRKFGTWLFCLLFSGPKKECKVFLNTIGDKVRSRDPKG